MKDISHIIAQFDFEGELLSFKEFGSGHINQTYIVKYSNNSAVKRYVLQQVNRSVFKDIDKLMENVFAVTSYLRERIEENGGDAERETLHFIKTKNGARYFEDADGSCYRAYVYVRNSVSYDSADTPELFGKSGAAFGKFQRLLAGFNADSLYEIIPHFHDTKWRYEHEFLPALAAADEALKAECQREIDFINQHQDEMGRLTDMIAAGQLPLRVTHNDTKLNNVMFDKDTNECVCVIDLDTVMPGVALYDFGEFIRFGASTAAEDEENLAQVSLDLAYFEAYAKGFLDEAGGALNDAEKEQLAFSARLITLELAMRFLTDYLQGNTYFKIEYPKHNLVRARNQLKLVEDMEQKEARMQAIIQQCTE